LRSSSFKIIFISSISERDRYKNEIWVLQLNGSHHYWLFYIFLKLFLYQSLSEIEEMERILTPISPLPHSCTNSFFCNSFFINSRFHS
jgi:hypothetical protein